MKTLRPYLLILALTLASAASAAAQNELAALDGSRVNIEAQSGKVVILAIGAAWLPLSAKQAEVTESLAKKYGNKNVAVYFVLTDSANPRSRNYTSIEDIKRFVSLNKVTVKVLLDPDGAATLRKYDVEQMPSFVLLDKKGTAAGETFGGIDPKFDLTGPISRAVDKLL